MNMNKEIINEERWKKECLEIYKRVLQGKYSHRCPDWDLLPIDETCPEFSGCTCYQAPAPEELPQLIEILIKQKTAKDSNI